MSKHSLDLKSLQWRLRRGMLELDVMLKRFVDSQLDHLDGGQLGALDQLLDQEDDLLWCWLSGQQTPPQKDLARLVERIRKAR